MLTIDNPGQTHDQGMNGSRVSHQNNAGPYYNQRGGRESYFDSANGAHNPRNRYGPRQQSDPALNRYNPNNAQGVYPIPTYGQSRDTVNTGGSNGSASDQWHQSTDPSSENSSIDRIPGSGFDPQARREPISEEGNYTFANGQASGYHPGFMNQGGPPVPPPKNGAAVPRREVIRLSETAGMPIGGSPVPLGTSPSSGNGRPSIEPKRKSWLKRTFSKNG
jgi:hypothetical protein